MATKKKSTEPAAAAAIPMSGCAGYILELNHQLRKRCVSKRNKLIPCRGQESAGCNCGGATGNGKCKRAELPDLHPCVSVSWGDTKCDCLETDDVERFCVTICNCYENVTFENVMLGGIRVVTATGAAPATLPDGSPSVEVIPLGPICFGNIGPCVKNQPSCVSREFAIVTRGAKGGDYRLLLGPLCFETTHHFAERELCFQFSLCADR